MFSYNVLFHVEVGAKFPFDSSFVCISLKIASITLKFCMQGYLIVNFKLMEGRRILKCSL